MVWNYFPRLLESPRHGLWSALRELERLQSDMSRRLDHVLHAEFPPVRVSIGTEGAVLTALLPGIEPSAIDLSVSGDTITLKGERQSPEPGEGVRWHRRERGSGSFARSFTLPFEVESGRVEARFENGVLQVDLPRSEAQKARKIQVATS
jgi:HSP20 family protein